jgi:hypothetical protein
MAGMGWNVEPAPVNGVKQELNFQWIKIGIVTKAESGVRVTSQPLRGAELALIEVRQGTKFESWGRVTSQLPKAWLVVYNWPGIVILRMVLKTEFSHLSGEELTRQSCSYRAMQLPPAENNNRSEHLAQTSSELPQTPNTTCLWTEGIKYYS